MAEEVVLLSCMSRSCWPFDVVVYLLFVSNNIDEILICAEEGKQMSRCVGKSNCDRSGRWDCLNGCPRGELYGGCARLNAILWLVAMDVPEQRIRLMDKRMGKSCIV